MCSQHVAFRDSESHALGYDKTSLIVFIFKKPSTNLLQHFPSDFPHRFHLRKIVVLRKGPRRRGMEGRKPHAEGGEQRLLTSNTPSQKLSCLRGSVEIIWDWQGLLLPALRNSPVLGMILTRVLLVGAPHGGIPSSPSDAPTALRWD